MASPIGWAYLREMLTIYQIEFFKIELGRDAPVLLECINAPADLGDLEAVKRHALGLPKPAGATGVLIRENNGPARSTVMF